MTIYSYINLNNLAWGTRETGSANDANKAKPKKTALYDCSCGNLCRCEMCWYALPDPEAERKAEELIKQQPKKRQSASLGVDTIYHIHERYILDREVDMVYENSKHRYKLDTLKDIAIEERSGKSSELEEEFKFWKNLVDEDLYHTNVSF